MSTLIRRILDRAIQGPQPPAMIPILQDLTPEEREKVLDLESHPEGWHGWHSEGQQARTLTQALAAVARREALR